MRLILIFFIIFIIQSCSEVEFVYDNKKNLINPLYEKTNVKVSGFDKAFLKSYIPMFFGQTKNEEFYLSILIKEKQTKRSIEVNQAVSNLRYEIRFFYEIKRVKENCIVYNKEILSTFSIFPKSSGFNYGTDASLEKKYELAIAENINRFVSNLSNMNLESCQ